MELKKKPELETNYYSSLIFNLILLLLLFLLNTAFEWRKTEINGESLELKTQFSDNEEIMIVTNLDIENNEQ